MDRIDPCTGISDSFTPVYFAAETERQAEKKSLIPIKLRQCVTGLNQKPSGFKKETEFGVLVAGSLNESWK